MATLLATLIFLGLAFAAIAIRLLFLKGGQFKGTCASQNAVLYGSDADCPVCGSKPGESCGKD